MSVREMMGRLNAATTKFDIGRGGLPTLTPQDLAAAVGMCKDKIAQEIFWWLYGPEHSVRPSNGDIAREMVLREVYREFEARYKAVEAARMVVHLLEFDVPETRRAQAEHQRHIDRAKAAVRQVHASVWPARDMSLYRRMVAVVAVEFRSLRQCPECDGRKQLIVNNVMVRCERCGGVGRVGLPNTWRAEHLGIDVARFRKTWLPVYEWIYNYVDSLQARACAEVAAAIGHDD